MADPVRDTRQAVEAARREMVGLLFRCQAEMQRTVEDGPCPMCADAVAAFEAAVRADEYRRIMDRGTDADAWEGKKSERP